MKKLLLAILFPFAIPAITFCTGCALNSATDSIQSSTAQTQNIARYKLFPTQNMWTFIKLDTQTGKMWLIQFSVDSEVSRFQYDLNPFPLAISADQINGRFELYPTQNIYNFILLDQIDGQTWQVQWSFDADKRFIVPIDYQVSTNLF